MSALSVAVRIPPGERGRALDLLTPIVETSPVGVVQSLVHISTVQTDRVVTVRFSFFFLQLLCFIGIAAAVALPMLR